MQLFILNGASGVGKTTLAQKATTLHPQLAWIHPDGLWPDTPTQTSEAIFERVAARLACQTSEEVVVDCQILPDRIHGLLPASIDVDVTIVLLHCPQVIREARLRARGWEDDAALFHIERWSALLYAAHERLGYMVIDTSSVTPADACARIFPWRAE